MNRRKDGMRIIVDAMGGDHAPDEIIKGSIEAVQEYGINLVLVGQEKVIKEKLSEYNAPADRFELVDAEEIITTQESPVMAIKKKPNSSMVKGLQMLRSEPNSVFLSAGSTGALMAGALLKVGRIKGIDRPALAPMIPNRKDGTLLIDAGANADCKVENLVQFAIMGSIYVEKVLGRQNPTVGLANIGEEETKGNELTKAAYQELKKLQNINFIGNIEARDFPAGVVDVLVCDGFVGNTILKLTEGLAINMFAMLKEEMMKSFTSKLGALLLKPGLKNFKSKMDYTEHGGAPLLGINGGVIKAHGSSNAKAIKNAIRQALKFQENRVLDHIKLSIGNFKEE